MKKLLSLIAVAVTSTQAAAYPWRILSPNDAYIDVYKNETVHDPYLAPIDSTLSYGSGFNLNLDVLKYKGLGIYWNNLLHFDQSNTDGRIKAAGWQYEIGATIWRNNDLDRVQVFKQHHSQHILEETRPVHFPVVDRYGIRLRLYP